MKIFLLYLFIYLLFLGCNNTSNENANETTKSNKEIMQNKTVNFNTTDDIINVLKTTYSEDGMSGVITWTEKTLAPQTTINVARDLLKPEVKEKKTIYDRAIMKLDKQGNELNDYYLQPLQKEDTEQSEVFLSIRLNFIEEPFELLIFTYVTPKEK
ncbi:MAG: hypothetical protein ABIN89_17345 [Chitinophagaceae bacterium]